MSQDLTTLDYSILANDAYDSYAILPAGVKLLTTSAAMNIGSSSDGFSANVYETLDGSLIIAFTGTDALWQDVPNGWTIAEGVASAQAFDAATLYYKIATTYGIDRIAAVTGQSLGGALAGLLNSLYGIPAVVFDNEPYEAAAANILYVAQNPTAAPNGQAVLSTFYPNGVSSETTLHSGGISGLAVDGEPLIAVRAQQGQDWSPALLSAGSASLEPDLPTSKELHSPSLITIYDYADTVYSNGSWQSAGTDLLSSLNNGALANAYDFSNSADLQSAIADSALTPDDPLSAGTVGVYGDVAISSLFSDENRLGEALSLSDPSDSFETDAQLISDVAVAFAADLAANSTSSTIITNGITNNTNDSAIIGVDVDSSDWQLGSASASTIPSESALLANMVSAITSNADYSEASDYLFGTTTPMFDMLDVSVTNQNITDILPEAPAGSSVETALYVGGSGNEDITTSAFNNVVQLGSGTDEVVGGAGADLLIAGSGSDSLFGGAGNNVIIGNGNNTSADYRYAPTGIDVDLADINSSFSDAVIGVRDNGSGGADTLLGISTLIGSNFADTFSLDNDTGGSAEAALQKLDGAGGFNTLDMTAFTNDVGLSVSWNALGQTTGIVNAGFIGGLGGESYPTLVNMEKYELPDFGNIVTISADDYGAGNAEPITFESGSAGSTYNISVAGSGAPIAIIGGGGMDTVNINTKGYDGSEGSSGAIIVDGEGGGAAIKITGSANVVFVQISDDADLSQANILDLENSVIASSGADTDSGPLVIVVNPTSQDTISLDGTTLKGAQTVISEQDFSWDSSDPTTNPPFVGGAWDEMNGQWYYTSSQQEIGEKYTAALTSSDGLSYDVESDNSVSATNSTDTVNLYGLVQGDAGITVTGGTPPMSRTENLFQEGAFDSNEYDYQEAGIPDLSTTPISVSAASFLGDDSYGPNSGVAAPSPTSSGAQGQGSPSATSTLSSGETISYGGSAPTVFASVAPTNIEQGQSGADTFQYTSGTGFLTVADVADTSGLAGSVLSLGAGIDASQLSISGDADGDLLLTDGVAGDLIVLQGMLAGGQGGGSLYGVGEISFSDGSVLTAGQLVALSDIGSLTNTTLYGNADANLFDSSGIADTAIGGGGADTFVYNSGYGQLDITEDAGAGNVSDAVLQLGAGITLADLTVSSDSLGNLIISDGGSNSSYNYGDDQIQLNGMMSSSEYGVGSVTFADGTSLTRAQLVQLALTGSSSNTYIYGSNGADTFNGGGYATEEQGNGGADTFVFNSGDPTLYISEDNGAGNTSTAVLEIGAGLDEADLTVSESQSGEIVLSFAGSTQQVHIEEMALLQGGAAEYGVSSVEFADGTVLTRDQLLVMGETPQAGQAAIFGTSGADTINSGGAVTFEQGNGGADTFTYTSGDGTVEINEDAGPGLTSAAVLQLGVGISASDISVSATTSGSLILTDGQTGDKITLDSMANGAEFGVQQVAFADGTTMTRAELLALNTKLFGSPSTTSLNESSGVASFDSEGFANFEQGAGGADTFVYDTGYGQLEIKEDAGEGAVATAVLQIAAGVKLADLTVSTDQAGDLVLRDGVEGDQITLDGMANGAQYGVAAVRFLNGVTLTYQQLAALEPTPIVASAGDSQLIGDPGANIFQSDGFAKSETGDGGADTFIYNAGWGSLQINEDGNQSVSSSAVLQFGVGISRSDLTAEFDTAGDEIISDGVAADQIDLTGMALPTSSAGSAVMGVTEASFADGTSLTRQQLLALPATPVDTTAPEPLLIGSSLGEIFDGQGVASYEQGNGGADTFIYNAGYGLQEIKEDAGAGLTSAAVLQIGGGLTASDLSVSGDSAGDILLTDGISGDQIKLDNEVDLGAGGVAEYGVSSVQFADGTSISRSQFEQAAVIGTADNTQLYGTTGAETIDSRGFATYAQGQGGADTFIYDAGYGQLEINEDAGAGASSSAVVAFGAGISAADITATYDGDGGLLLSDGVPGDQITIDGLYNAGATGLAEYGVSEVTFADGSSLTRQQVIDLAATGSADNTALYGSSGADILDSRGYATYAQGGGGADTFIYEGGYGQLEIDEDSGAAAASAAVLQVGAGLTASDFTASFDSEGDVNLTDGVPGDQIELDSELAVGPAGALEYGVSAVQFADGTSITKAQLQKDAVTGGPGNTSLYGTANADLFDSRGYATYAQGDGGADTFIYNAGYGQLEINEDVGWGSATNAELTFGAGLTASDLTVSSDANDDLILSDGVAGDTITLDEMVNYAGQPDTEYGVSNVIFADGTELTAQQLTAMLPAVLDGTAGNETLQGFGFRSQNVFIAGDGDTLDGTNADTYQATSTSGNVTINPASGENVDTLAFDSSISEADVTLQADGNNLIVTDAKADLSITVQDEFWSDWGNHVHLNDITFSDGTVWNLAYGDNVNLTSDGSAGDQTLVGSTWATTNIFLGGDGDTLNGVNADTYELTAAAGTETINPGSGTNVDTIVFDASVNEADVTLQAYGANLVITDAKDGIAITVNNEFWSNWGTQTHVGAIDFADGSILSLGAAAFSYDGSAGNETINGSAWAATNLFLGGDGDTLNGTNSDTYQFTAAAGVETINPSANQTSDIIAFDSTVNEADVTLQVYGGNLVVSDASADVSITVNNEFWNSWGVSYDSVNAITFADGTVWTLGQGNPLNLTYDGTAGDQTLTGSGYGDTNLFLGANGDTMNGANTDIYKIGANVGTETINLGSSDTVQFGGSITSQDLWFATSGSNLEIDVLGTTEQLTIDNWSNNQGALAAIDASDGLQVDTQLNALINAMATFTADNAGFNPAGSVAMPMDQSLQASLAAAWHTKAA
ncbi:MAG: calcium-binding protein [Caulobacteraceae bacterium]